MLPGMPGAALVNAQVARPPIDAGKGETSPAITLLLGPELKGSVRREVTSAIWSEMSVFPTTIIDLEQAEQHLQRWPDQGVIVAAGVSGCEQAAQAATQSEVICTLLTEENFLTIYHRQEDRQRLSALVIDQPLIRQARIANTVYPALRRFAVVTNNESAEIDDSRLTVDIQPYRTSRSLAPQLESAIRTHDALIAVPRHEIFNRSTLRTVLLTAYGYGKPVVGLSQGYVNAGALITCYTTPAQIFKQLAELLVSNNWQSIDDNPVVRFPRYFSIADNVNVARSLGLTKLFNFDEKTTYIDGDFSL